MGVTGRCVIALHNPVTRPIADACGHLGGSEERAADQEPNVFAGHDSSSHWISASDIEFVANDRSVAPNDVGLANLLVSRFSLEPTAKIAI